MIHEYPDYYKKFKCIGGECEDSCCIGWEIDIDEDTFQYYKNVEGPFGKRLRDNMQENGDNSFILSEHDRCPFLNAENLCDIFTELGEMSLCKICTEYPRYTQNLGDYSQSDMSLSCMELGRIFFMDENSICYEKREDDLSLDDEDTEFENEYCKKLMTVRDKVIEIMKNRKYSLMARINCCRRLVSKIDAEWIDDEFDELIKDDRLEELLSNIEDYMTQNEEADYSTAGECDIDSIRNRLIEYLILADKFEIIDDSWIEQINKVKDSVEEIVSNFSSFMECIGETGQNYYEKIYEYFIFRYFIQTYNDDCLIARLMFAEYSTAFISFMDVKRWLDNGRSFDVNDRVDVCHIYSKEVEHSAENIDVIMDFFKPEY